MIVKYDPKMIEGHFDFDPESEWKRLDTDPHGKVQFHIHQHYLKKYIKDGDRVFEIGPGPGRFTIELGKLGATIAIADISKEQLRLNEIKVKEAGFDKSVEWRKKLDIISLEGIPNNSFDATVCFGGPFSYVLDQIDKALEEVLRVTKPGGCILASVSSRLGTFLHLTEAILDEIESGNYELDEIDDILRTGDIFGKYAARGTHQIHMFRWSEFQKILGRYPVDILDASAANFLSTGFNKEDRLTKVMNDKNRWETLLKWELDVCAEPGAIDASTHFLVVFRKQA